MGGTDGTWRGSVGVHGLTSRRAADPGARFRAGSTTKVTAAVPTLAPEHRVDLGAPTQHCLPGLFDPAFRPLTVGKLPNHISGVRAGDNFAGSFSAQYAHRYEGGRALVRLRGRPARTPPRRNPGGPLSRPAT